RLHAPDPSPPAGRDPRARRRGGPGRRRRGGAPDRRRRPNLGGDLLPRLPLRRPAQPPALRARGPDLCRYLRALPLHRPGELGGDPAARLPRAGPRLRQGADGLDPAHDRGSRRQQRHRLRHPHLMPGPSTSPEPAVVARELSKSYDGRVAVDSVSFSVEPGIGFGFLGPNGAGKTTTMKMIYGLATIGDGELRVLGLDAARERRRIKARIGVVPPETNLDADLTLEENLLMQSRYFGIDGRRARARAAELLEFALVNDPELIVLDEPTTGLDPQARLAVWATLGELRSRGVTLLLTTHYMEEA